MTSQPRVVVVGGGIIGLTSALALLQRGFKGVRVVADDWDDIVSHVAGAIWMPFALPTDIDTQQTKKWCEVSMAWLDELWRTHGEDAVGIHYVKGVDVMAGGPVDASHPYWAHCVKDYRQLTPEEANAVCAGMTHGNAFETIIYKPTTLMDWLKKQIVALGGTLETRHVDSVDALSGYDLIVNCTGLGAKQFVKDESMFPVRGQVIRVRNPDIKTFTMIVHRDGSHTYVLPRPKGEVVVGGTVQPHNWKRENDAQDVKGIWERAIAAVPAVAKSEILSEHCGLRPNRTNGVRLEVDPHRTASGAVVIHNYGHVGSGHTLQWGCAQDVVRLATQYFPQPPSRSRL